MFISIGWLKKELFLNSLISFDLNIKSVRVKSLCSPKLFKDFSTIKENNYVLINKKESQSRKNSIINWNINLNNINNSNINTTNTNINKNR